MVDGAGLKVSIWTSMKGGGQCLAGRPVWAKVRSRLVKFGVMVSARVCSRLVRLGSGPASSRSMVMQGVKIRERLPGQRPELMPVTVMAV